MWFEVWPRIFTQPTMTTFGLGVRLSAMISANICTQLGEPLFGIFDYENDLILMNQLERWSLLRGKGLVITEHLGSCSRHLDSMDLFGPWHTKSPEGLAGITQGRVSTQSRF